MKRIIKRIVACIVFLSILVASFLRVSDILEAKNSRVKYDAFFNSDTNFDVIFMGTSHAYHSVFTQDLWKNYGISSYNWGFSHGTVVENYYVLREALKYTNPKLVVVDLYGITEYENKGNGKYISGRIEQRHTQFDSLPLTKDKVEAVRDIYDDYDNNYDFLFDFALWHNRWFELEEKDFNCKADVQKGSGILFGYKESHYTKVDEYKEIDINTVCAQYVPKIVDLCAEKDIDLLFVYLPYPAAGNKQQYVANQLNTFLEPYDCDYLNMLDLGILNPVTDAYVDGTHLNHMGGYKTTMWLGEYIQDKYNLTDYRNDSAYQSWNDEREEYVDFKASRFNKSATYDGLIENLILAYGDDFEVKVKLKYNSEVAQNDKVLHEILDTYTSSYPDNVSVVNARKTIYRDKRYDVILTIKKASTGEKVFQKGYKLDA